MKKIKLTRGKYAIIDDSDFKLLSKYKWHFNDSGYARKSSPKMYMHRMIIKAKKGEQCDHINGDKLDNRRSNLRLCTEKQNHYNVGLRSDNKSGYRGVSFDKSRKKWTTAITKDGKTKHIGRFESIKEAVKAYNSFAINLYGEFARINEI